MPRGYRCILFALVGWLTLSAQAPQPKTEPERSETATAISRTSGPPRPIPVEVVNQPSDPARYQDPCKGDEGDSRSDLCAQWTAANAARNAAKYALWQLWAAGAGMVGLIFTLLLTLQAVKAAKATVRTQIEAERPLVLLDGIHIECVKKGFTKEQPICLSVNWKLKNFGRSGCWIERMYLGGNPGSRKMKLPTEEGTEITAFVEPNGGTLNSVNPLEWWLHANEWATLDATLRARVAGFVQYRDAGGRVWRTRFLFEAKLSADYRSESFSPVPSDIHWEDGLVSSKKRRKF